MDESMNTFLESIKAITELDEGLLTDEAMATIENELETKLSIEATIQVVNSVLRNLDDQGLNKREAAESVEAIKNLMNEMVYGENQYTGNKKKVIDKVMSSTFAVFDRVLEQYHKYNIELPIALDEGAVEPTYAHESDAAADLYALEDVTVQAHTYGNKIHTGVHIQLPESWLAFVLPRSSIGMKTPLRLSNSVGLIDSGYRGELIALYDNTSDTDYSINKGDRIAQLLVMPSYRFKSKIVDSLEDSDRGQGGFGSTGV